MKKVTRKQTQTRGVSRSLTTKRIALWRHCLRTQCHSFCTKHLDIDCVVHSALYPTDESFSLKGYSSRNGKLMTHTWSWNYEWAVHFQYSDRGPRRRVYAMITSSCIHTHTHTHIEYRPAPWQFTLENSLRWRRKSYEGGSRSTYCRASGRERDTFLTNGVFCVKYLCCRNSLRHKGYCMYRQPAH